MPEYQLQIVASSPDCMGEIEARDYAPQWGSAVGNGDPGAVMYGEPSEPESAAAMLAHVEQTLIPLADHNGKPPDDESDDRTELRRLAAYLRTVTAESVWDKASPLERGFIECLFFLAPDDSESDDGDIHREGAVSQLAPKAWAKVRAMCAAFEREAGQALADAIALPDYSSEQAGRDLCFTLLGAGVGFTDREQLENRAAWEALGSPRVGDPAWPAWERQREDSPGHRLAQAARACGHCEGLYRGDDGRLYLWAESIPAIEREG